MTQDAEASTAATILRTTMATTISASSVRVAADVCGDGVMPPFGLRADSDVRCRSGFFAPPCSPSFPSPASAFLAGPTFVLDASASSSMNSDMRSKLISMLRSSSSIWDVSNKFEIRLPAASHRPLPPTPPASTAASFVSHSLSKPWKNLRPRVSAASRSSWSSVWIAAYARTHEQRRGMRHSSEP
jgi:hypothetical protein